MWSLSPATRVYLAAGATDMRKGFNGLTDLVRQQLREDPLSGHLFLFCNRPRNRLKALYWDGSGLWLCAKRLEKGGFSWPEAESGPVRLEASELALLLSGVELERTRRKDWWRH